ncbi:O-antigen ligase family protein [Stutzerimonas stutzeri]|uniref:O-antigen ligase family protein n=1 Tax=Stutzerimonas stutzeri TaxID=316 RepID=UPI0037188523
MKAFGFWILLFPLALLGSLESTLISFVVYMISLLVSRNLTYIDWSLVAVALIFVLSYFAESLYGRSFIVSQISSYICILLVLRFCYVSRDELWLFINRLPSGIYILLCLVYLFIQLRVGYVYEVGVLEAFMLIKACSNDKARNQTLLLLLAYLLIMFLISTRSTPLIVAAIIAIVFFFRCPRSVLKLGYLAVLILSPIYGFIIFHLDVEVDVSGIDDNAAIRLEMIKGATSMIGIQEFLIGVGFGVPFRSITYDYAFGHPLLVVLDNVMQTSNHNSLFDLFLRFGVVVYIVFGIVFMRALKLGQVRNSSCYALLYVTLYLLSVNAYTDSTRLAPSCAVFLVGILLLTSRQSRQSVPHPGVESRLVETHKPTHLSLGHKI